MCVPEESNAWLKDENKRLFLSFTIQLSDYAVYFAHTVQIMEREKEREREREREWERGEGRGAGQLTCFLHSGCY